MVHDGPALAEDTIEQIGCHPAHALPFRPPSSVAHHLPANGFEFVLVCSIGAVLYCSPSPLRFAPLYLGVQHTGGSKPLQQVSHSLYLALCTSNTCLTWFRDFISGHHPGITPDESRTSPEQDVPFGPIDGCCALETNLWTPQALAYCKAGMPSESLLQVGKCLISRTILFLMAHIL
jgi:hypothetical protein